MQDRPAERTHPANILDFSRLNIQVVHIELELLLLIEAGGRLPVPVMSATHGRWLSLGHLPHDLYFNKVALMYTTIFSSVLGVSAPTYTFLYNTRGRKRIKRVICDLDF